MLRRDSKPFRTKKRQIFRPRQKLTVTELTWQCIDYSANVISNLFGQILYEIQALKVSCSDRCERPLVFKGLFLACIISHQLDLELSIMSRLGLGRSNRRSETLRPTNDLKTRVSCVVDRVRCCFKRFWTETETLSCVAWRLCMTWTGYVSESEY